MYLLNIKNVTDKKVLSNIYNNINQFGLGDKFFIVYEKDYVESPEIDKNILAHVFVVDTEQLKHYSEDTIENIVLDLIEMGGFVIIRHREGDDVELVSSICSSFKLNHLFIKDHYYENDIDLVNVSVNDIKIVNEIINGHIDENKYSFKDFMFRYTVDSEGNVIDEYSHETILNLYESDFVEILFHKPAQFELLKKEVNSEVDKETGLSHYFYEPWLFLLHKTDMNSKIINYKMKVFNAIKNIDPEDYPVLRPEMVEIFNNAGYIKFNDIKKIIASKEL